MNPDWATENLQVIRTLMERATVYRRALGPVMLASGALGIAAAALPCFDFFPRFSFAGYWMAVSIFAVALSFLLVRRQALKAGEPFWSPPTRRVFQAMLPGLFAGLAVGIAHWVGLVHPPPDWVLALLWMMFYGCSIHAAGFFMPRGMKLFGALLLCSAGLLLFILPDVELEGLAHYVMGTFFGVCHLGYGLYLVMTEQRKNAS